MSASHSRLQKKRKRAFPDRIPLTPMIDVVFLLLIFFVMTFEIPDRLTEMKVWRAQSKGTPGTFDRITVLEANSTAKTYAFNGRAISTESLRSYTLQLADNNPLQTIVVVAKHRSKHEDLVYLLNLFEDAGLENVSLLSVE
jgi:biopolymer transport protein ExbD